MQLKSIKEGDELDKSELSNEKWEEMMFVIFKKIGWFNLLK